MFPLGYFPKAYFAASYFPPIIAIVIVAPIVKGTRIVRKASAALGRMRN